MKCQGCGHEFSTTLLRCPRCRRLSSRRPEGSGDSRLIEFPRRTKASSQSEPPEASLPAWRIELNEKVRARRAKQTSDDEIGNASAEPEQQPAIDAASMPPREAGQPTTLSSAPESPSFLPDAAYSRRRRTEAVPRASYSSASLDTASSNNPIVRAALSRARRASETASRAALPRIESNRPLPAARQNTVAVDRDATARVLEPAPEIDSFSTAAPASPPEFPADSYTQPEHVEPVAPRRIVTAPIISDERPSYGANDLPEVGTTAPIDELEPCDYLEAEVRRVDKALSAEFSRNESPSLGTHVIINVIDLLVVAISCLPFMAAIALANGSFDSFQTQTVSIGIIALVSCLYLGLTHCLCGKTMGMMLTNTRIVDAASFGDPTRKRALMRAAGYFLAIAPAMVGFLWIAGNAKRRGWHDFISGTFVARDF